MKARAILPVLVLASAAASFATDLKSVFPPGVKPVGPYSPGVVAGGLLYVSGQGARDAANNLPPTVEGQVRQCLENVKAIVQAEGLTMAHVVTTNVYLADMAGYATLNKVWKEYFPKDAPARTVIGVTRMPTDTPVEIAATAVRDLTKKKVIPVRGVKIQEPVSLAVGIGDRVFLSGAAGRDLAGKIPSDVRAQTKLIIDSTEKTLKAAGLELRHMAYVNIYVDPGMPMPELMKVLDEYIPDEAARTIVQTAALPYGVHLQITGLASRERKRAGGHCSVVVDTVYCSGRAGTIRQTLDTLKADLEVSGIPLTQTVSANVYIDELDQFAAMNKVYGTFFGKVAPTRTTVQPWKRVAELSLPASTDARSTDDGSPRVQVSIIAVR